MLILKTSWMSTILQLFEATVEQAVWILTANFFCQKGEKYISSSCVRPFNLPLPLGVYFHWEIDLFYVTGK